MYMDKIKKKVLLLPFLALLLLPAVSSYGQTAVGVAQLGSDQDARSAAVAHETTRVIELILNQMDGYYAQRLSAVKEGQEAVAVGQNDYLIHGNVEKTGQATRITLRLYGKQSQQEDWQIQRDIESAFELFDVAEQAAVALLENLSGQTLRFAELRFVNNGRPGAYRVLIDGYDAGNDVQRLRVLAGTREIQVVQDRMLAVTSLYSQSANLTEGQQRAVEFSIPLLTPEERSRVLAIEEEIAEKWDDPEQTEQVAQLFSRLDFLLADTAYSTDLVEQKERFAKMRRDFELAAAERGTPVKTEDEAAGEKPGWRLGGAVGLAIPLVHALEEHPGKAAVIYGKSLNAYLERKLLSWFAVQLNLALGDTETRLADEEVMAEGGDESPLYGYFSLETALLLQPQLDLGPVSVFLSLGPAIAIGPVRFYEGDMVERYGQSVLALSHGGKLGAGLRVGLPAGWSIGAGALVTGLMNPNAWDRLSGNPMRDSSQPALDTWRREVQLGFSKEF